jgi:anaerobic C4-dicarboxylate transporter
MSRYVEELHTKEDTTNLWDSFLFFLGLIAVVSVFGIVFWVAV